MLASMSPTRRRVTLLAALGAALVLLVVAVVLVVRQVGGDDPVAQDEPGPVLLVSGYGGGTASLRPLRDALRVAGRTVVVVPVLGDGTGDIGAQAEALDDAADEAMDRYDAPSVDVVGYSAGGVVARSWVRDHGGAGKARRVVGLGSPQHGTDVADLAGQTTGCPEACEQLAPDSGFLRALNARDETPAGPRFIALWSDTDQVVVPGSSARLDGALNLSVQSVCPSHRTSHGDLPADIVSIVLMSTALDTGPPTAPSGLDCG